MKGSSDEVEAESEVSDVSMDNDEVDLAQLPVKYLIFTTGSKTYTPHQIGKKLEFFVKLLQAINSLL